MPVTVGGQTQTGRKQAEERGWSSRGGEWRADGVLDLQSEGDGLPGSGRQ